MVSGYYVSPGCHENVLQWLWPSLVILDLMGLHGDSAMLNNRMGPLGEPPLEWGTSVPDAHVIWTLPAITADSQSYPGRLLPSWLSGRWSESI